MSHWELPPNTLMQTVSPRSSDNLNLTSKRSFSGDGTCVVFLASFLRLLVIATFGLVQHQFHVTSELCYLLGAAGSSLCLFCLGTGSNYVHVVK